MLRILRTKLVSFTRLVGFTLSLHLSPAREEEEQGFEHIVTRIILKALEFILDRRPIGRTRKKLYLYVGSEKEFPPLTSSGRG